MNHMYRSFLLIVLWMAVVPFSTHGQTTSITIKNSSEFSQAIDQLRPGTTLLLEPGMYSGNVYLRDIAGQARRPIVIQGADANHPPVFEGGNQAFHLANCSYVTLRNMRVRGFPTNGINIDDGGTIETPAHHIIVENVTILNTGPTGNHDALKMSGVDHFLVRNCRFEGWGGSGIDMVGCHHGIVEDCTFTGRTGFSQSNGVQLKGGTEDVLVQCCRFKNAGHRSINLGGSTGLPYFRPEVLDYEAKNITIAGNQFVGSMAPVAWVTSHGGHVHHNTMIMPENWVLRILQESPDARFTPYHHGVFEHNLIIFDARVRVFVNVGPGTSPETFKFQHNAWYAIDGDRKPSLPVPEINGLYLRTLAFDKASLSLSDIEDERLDGIGARAYTRARK